LDKIVPELHTHNVFLADEYLNSFDDIFKRQQIPEEPSFYVNVPSRVDPSAAPEGKDSVVVLVPCGHLMEGEIRLGLNPQTSQDWNAMVSKARNAVFETIQLRTGLNLRPLIVDETINTPASWRDKFNLDKGAILGLSHSFFNVLSFRPATKHSSFDGLYFVGASTHPGTGVPIVLAGSKITTSQILDDLGMLKPWTSSGHKRRIVSSLDTEGSVPFDAATAVVVAILAFVLLILGYTWRGDPNNL
jgi:phytoene desaturase (3,4-didehydrolycopene-forming)